MGIKELLKFRLRRGLGTLDLTEKMDALDRQIQAIHDLLLNKDKTYNPQIRAFVEFLLEDLQHINEAYHDQIQSLIEQLTKLETETHGSHDYQIIPILKFLLDTNKSKNQVSNHKIHALLDLLIKKTDEQGDLYQNQINLLLKENEKKLIQNIVDSSKPGAVLSCCINGMELLAPAEQLRMYPHCLHPQNEQKLAYFVETQQSDWLCSKIKPGDEVVDIGAAFGLISVAMSKAVSSQGRVYAFEPSRNTQKFLQQVLALNDIQNVTIVQSAISDRPGTADFIEYTDDNELSWASDASTLAVEAIEPTLKHRLYQVEVTTIDRYITTVGIQPQVIKIDIEGFELYALHGGRATLQKFSPYLCIDIHTDVRTGESALIGVEPYLLELGYELHMEGHALYCTPKNKLLD